jgi:putative endonuclease
MVGQGPLKPSILGSTPSPAALRLASLAQCRLLFDYASEAKCPEHTRRRTNPMYYLYFLLCDDNSIYTGVTNDIERRFSEHKNKKGGHYTSSHNAVKIIYTEEYPTQKEALTRERQIKGWRREKKIKLINE